MSKIERAWKLRKSYDNRQKNIKTSLGKDWF